MLDTFCDRKMHVKRETRVRRCGGVLPFRHLLLCSHATLLFMLCALIYDRAHTRYKEGVAKRRLCPPGCRALKRRGTRRPGPRVRCEVVEASSVSRVTTKHESVHDSAPRTQLLLWCYGSLGIAAHTNMHMHNVHVMEVLWLFGHCGAGHP